MAGLAAQFPGQQVSNDLYNALDFYGWDQRNRQFESAMQNEQHNRRSALQDYLFNEQNNPIKLRQADLNADTTAAELPGKQAQSTSLGVKARIDTATEKDATRAKMAEFAKTMSDSDWTQAENAVKQALIDPSPQVRQIGEQLYGQLVEVKKLREQLRSSEGIHAATNETSRYVADKGAESRQAVAATAAATKTTGGARNFLASFDRLKANKDRYGALLTEATRVEADNPDAADLYRRMAEQIRPAAEAELKTDPKAGGVDLTQLPGRGLAVQPPKAITPPNNPTAASPNPSPVVDRRIRVVSPDGKIGTIPAGQLQDALKQGFKQQ